MKHKSFVTAVDKISHRQVDDIPELAAVISYWNEDVCAPEEWMHQVEDYWGPAGLALRRGDEVLGTAIFAPPDFFRRAERFFRRPSDENVVFLAYVSGDPRTRKHLLVRALKELRQKGVAGVEAIAGGSGTFPHVSERFLADNGWRPVRRVLRGGRTYTLMRMELGSTVEVGELARDIIGRVKLPGLKNPSPLPGEAFVQVELPSGNGSTAVLTVEMPSGVVA